MTGSLGAGTFFAGAYLWWDTNGVLTALISRMGEFAPAGPALPGLLMLSGTAILGFVLIRMQNA